MTRRYTDQLIQELPNELPDNTAGDITPAVLRQMINDVIMSLRPAFAGVYGTHTGAPLNVTLNKSTWTPINTTGLFTDGASSEASEIGFNLTTGAIIVKLSPYNHFFNSEISFEGPNGRLLDLAIGVNGVPVTFFGATECLGNNILQTFSARGVAFPAQNASVQLLGKWYGGAATNILKVSMIRLIGELQTTRYP